MRVFITNENKRSYLNEIEIPLIWKVTSLHWEFTVEMNFCYIEPTLLVYPATICSKKKIASTYEI